VQPVLLVFTGGRNLKICSPVIYLLMQVSPVSAYEPVLRSRVLQESTVSPLPKVLATFYSTCKFSNVRKGLSRDWTDPEVCESIAHFHTVAFGYILLSFKCKPKFRLFNDAVCSADCIAFYATSSFCVRNPYQSPAVIYHVLKKCVIFPACVISRSNM
jgi:hypothetical protein